MRWSAGSVVAGTLVGGVAAALVGCLSFQPFSCETDAQCDDRQGGVCADTMFCAYPDADCVEAGLRYDAHAGDGLAGECVGEHTGTTSTEPSTDSIGSLDTTMPTSVDPSATDTTTLDDSTDATEDTGPACGGLGETCCDGDTCEAGLACDAAACVSCIVGIEAGDRHTCVLRTDGDLVCWGANDLGQLGDSDAAFEPLPVLAVATEPDDRIIEVSAVRHTCVRSENGNVRCWGDNGSNQVDPAPSPAIAPTTPATWAPPSIHIATGLAHTCAADSTTTTCWGSNASSQLGSAAAGPGPITFGNPGYEDVVLGGSHSCAITADESVSCWGSNGSGQLAQDPATVPVVVDPALIALPAGADALALGREHTCALMGDAVSCWGRNDLGQLGDGSGAQQIAPVPIVFPAQAGAITTITAGPHHTCAIDDAMALWCWGSNDNGQLMLEPDDTGNDLYTLVPVAIDVGEDVVSVTTGQTHTCAVTDSARILCWGTNTAGQIGDGTTTFAFEPTQVVFDCE